MNNKLYIMMGVPGSGKTTWCKNNINFDESVYISRDTIRFSILKPNEPYFSKEKEVYKTFTNQIAQALKRGKNVYADQTSLDEKARAKLINSLEDRSYEIHVIWLNTPLGQCLKQNSLRTGLSRVPDESIIQMSKRLTRPTWAEGIRYLHIITNGEEKIIDLEEEANKEWTL